MGYTARRHPSASRFAVGDRVRIRFGERWVTARVIERGPIGVGGRDLLRIRVDDPGLPDDDREFELSATDVEEAVSEGDTRKRPHGKPSR
jgi:hypothetical protein